MQHDFTLGIKASSFLIYQIYMENQTVFTPVNNIFFMNKNEHKQVLRSKQIILYLFLQNWLIGGRQFFISIKI